MYVQRNIEARSSNHCCTGKAISIRYSECMFVDFKMNLQEVGGGRGDWMELAQDRDRWRALVGTVRDFPVL